MPLRSAFGTVNWSDKPVPLHALTLPEEFLVRIEYDDGQCDEVFPALLPAGARVGRRTGFGLNQENAPAS